MLCAPPLLVLHVITGLGRGGAEAALERLVSASRDRCRHVVVSLSDEGVHGARLHALGVSVHALGWPRGRVRLGGAWELWRLMRRLRPDVVQTWMYHADLVGGVLARLAGVPAVIWGLHNADLHPARSRRGTRIVAELCAQLSRWVPHAIASCSERAAQVHVDMGYAPKFHTIPNGYDLAHWQYRPQARQARRARWGVGPDAPLIGMIARWHPQKDHANLLAALAQVAPWHPGLVCVLVGPGMDDSNFALQVLVQRSAPGLRIVLAGPDDDVPAAMAALDLHVLSSAGEAFPNVVAEAMACGTPCVVTDVGDAARMVGTTGWVVPPGDAQALAGAIEDGLRAVQGAGREALRSACRRHVEQHYGLDRMAQAYVELWRGIRPQPR